MLKKSCPYHKTPVNHTLEQCDMLKKNYSHVTVKEDQAKKDGGDRGVGGFPTMENIFLIFGGADGRHVQQPAQAGAEPPSAARITRTASPTRASTRWS
jgi:hypothetical protein